MAEEIMKTITLAFLITIWILVWSAAVTAKSWRGIVPLHSTCEDVRRLLGHASCKADSYDLENENVFISFTKKHCDGDSVKWNVPAGTVLSIDVNPKIKPRLADVIGDETRYTQSRDPHLPDIVYYADKEEGLTLQVFPNGDVGSFFYGPTAKDHYLRCTNSKTDKDSLEELRARGVKFDEYGKLTFYKERVRLQYFAAALRQQPNVKGFIVVHNSRARDKAAHGRAKRARKYLVNAQGLPAERIEVVEGNYTKTPTVELYLGPLGMSGAERDFMLPRKH
jgi:hypothetical protein